MIVHRHSLRALAIALFSAALPMSALPLVALAEAPAKPNIILVMTDDQGYGDLACHGNPVIKTPHLDAFYKAAVRFTDYHVSPTCSPTRSSLLTGRHEFKNGITHTIHERERLTLKAFTVAQLLKSAGYATGIFGKWHLGDEAEYQPGRRGFDEVFIHGAGGIGQSYPGSCGDAPGNKYFNPTILHNGKFEKTQGYCTDVFFNQATRWIDEQRQAGKPFFAYITPNCPHGPLDCPAEYEQPYKGQVPPNVAKFFGMITNIDDNFGRLMAKLREWSLERDTLVIFQTDNGTATGHNFFNAGMRGQKGTAYQGGTRVPALWRWPAGFAGGRDIGQLTAHLDVFPTFAEITGAKIPAEWADKLDGRSLVPLLKDEKTAAWPDRLLVTHVGRWEKGEAADNHYAACSIRNSRFTLVNAARQGEKWELFDLVADPGEKTNVIDQHPEVAKKLKAALDAWWVEVTPLLVNEDAVGPAENPYKVLYRQQFGQP
ncbi:MAG: arylsulfatase [Pirellulaceae bacterium]|nr:arylsulfatase [Pirellulaceae bacterium]